MSGGVLVLGANGMLGHKLLQRLPPHLGVLGAVRRLSPPIEEVARSAGARLIGYDDITHPGTIQRLLRETAPSVIVNCIGAIKQRDTDPQTMVAVNSTLPHTLADACAAGGVRLIHLSTDCVFSGRRGAYEESDVPDPVDLYGQSKLDGEVGGAGVLTLRTSMVGRELQGFHSLMEWFLGQAPNATVTGYRNAIFSGLTTNALASEIGRIIVSHPDLSGIFQVSAAPIDKCALLRLLGNIMRPDITVVPVDDPHIDRSLRSDCYGKASGYLAPSWQTMIDEVSRDPTPYARLQASA
jgi:dTDP-4-dehydrorhamnose reductase